MDNAYDMGRKRGQEESRKEIERLKKALEKYSVHNCECGVYASDNDEDYGICTCGLQQALKGE